MRADVAILGAGTAGAAAAALCARRGLSVVCLERRSLSEAGARWVNGVAAWQLEAAGIAPPAGPELVGEGHSTHLVAGRGPVRIVIEGAHVLEVDMRLLVARLQLAAREAGAFFLERTRVAGREGRVLRTSAGPIEAAWFVDASGMSGARLLGQPRVPRRDVCSAAQEVRFVRDAAAARAFFEQHVVRPGDTLCFTGIAGGYSILQVRLMQDRVGLLTGTIPADGQPSAKALLDMFVHEQRWIGEREYGGARAIPLRRPFDLLARGNTALIGDAACQVFPAHGSGIGPHLVAARHLADALADGRGPEGYAARWMRDHGGILAAYDLFRRFSQTLDAGDIVSMMQSGLLDPTSVRGGMEQRWPDLQPTAYARRFLREPRMVARLAPVLARMSAVRALYAAYPGTSRLLPPWSRAVARLFGETADDNVAVRAAEAHAAAS